MNIAILTLLFLGITLLPVMANGNDPQSAANADPFVEAQEKLQSAKGNYRTIRQQENAIQDMRKATRLSLRAAKLRAKAEKLQTKADVLVNKANQHALSRGLYITTPDGIMMQPPPSAKDQTAKATVPVPGQPVNIIFPQKQEEVSLDNSNIDQATVTSY